MRIYVWAKQGDDSLLIRNELVVMSDDDPDKALRTLATHGV